MLKIFFLSDDPRQLEQQVKQTVKKSFSSSRGSSALIMPSLSINTNVDLGTSDQKNILMTKLTQVGALFCGEKVDCRVFLPPFCFFLASLHAASTARGHS